MTVLTAGSRATTWLLALLSLALGIAGIVVPLALGDFVLGADTGILAFVVAAPILGLILVLRAGALRMGRLLLAMGLGAAMAGVGEAIPLDPQDLAWVPLVPFANAGWIVFLASTIAALPLLFPTGEPITPRWRPVLWALLVLVPVAASMMMFSEDLTIFCSDVMPGDTPCSVWAGSGEPVAIQDCRPTEGPLGTGTACEVVLDNPIGVSGVQSPETGLLGSLLYAALLGISALAIVSFGLRFHRAGPDERQQIKLVFFVLGFLVVSSLVEAVVVDFFGGALPAMELIDFVMWVAIPVSIFLAITRYRLFDIDRIISRTLSYSIVVALLVGVVAAVAALVGTRFSDPVVVAGTTLTVAALFNPVRRRVQSLVDRRFNRARYDAEQVADRFMSAMRDRADAEVVLSGWLGVVDETMRPSSIGVWVRR